MHRTWKLALVSATITVGGCKGSPERTGGAGQSVSHQSSLKTTEYTVILKSTWTAATHPFEYPRGTGPNAPHFSGLIGATHDQSYAIFAEGTTPTPGLERLSEEGNHRPLNDEISVAIVQRHALSLFETDPLRMATDSLVTIARVDSLHPLVSLVAMIVPSPDWFAGVRNVNLMENGAWVATRTVELRPYDAGGDDGATYKAPDRNNDPKKPATLNTSRHFTVNGVVSAPVGSVTFIRK